MKNCMVWMLILIIIFSLSGCQQHQDDFKIESNDWIMSTVQNANENGNIIAYGKDGEPSSVPAKELNLKLEAKNGKLLLLEQDTEKSYEGTYRLLKKSENAYIYQIFVESTEGQAVASFTSEKSKGSSPTLVCTLGDYTVNFVEK